MPFDFQKMMTLGNKPQSEANAGADALMQSLGMSQQPQTNINGSTGIANPTAGDSSKQDAEDMKDIMTIFGGGVA